MHYVTINTVVQVKSQFGYSQIFYVHYEYYTGVHISCAYNFYLQGVLMFSVNFGFSWSTVARNIHSPYYSGYSRYDFTWLATC